LRNIVGLRKVGLRKARSEADGQLSTSRDGSKRTSSGSVSFEPSHDARGQLLAIVLQHSPQYADDRVRETP